MLNSFDSPLGPDISKCSPLVAALIVHNVETCHYCQKGSNWIHTPTPRFPLSHSMRALAATSCETLTEEGLL